MADAAGETPPAPGKGRNPIIDAIYGVLQENGDPASLREVLIRAQGEMKSLREQIAANYVELDEAVRAASADAFEQVNNALDVYESGLTLAGQYFQDGLRNTLIRGGEILRRGHWLVNETLFTFRNTALCAMGPTNIPDFNLLHQHYERVKQGEEPRDGVFNRLVESQGLATVAGIGEADKQPPSEARDTILGVYRRHMAALRLLHQYVQEGREELLEKGMVDARASFTEIRDMIPAMQMKLRTGVPTKMPTANFVINMAVEVAAGRVGQGALRDALDQLRGVYESMRRQFDSVARGHIESVLISEEAEKVREAFSEMEGAIDQLYRFFDDHYGDRLGDGCNRLVDAVARLYQSHQTFTELADREGKTLCIRCQHYNDKSRKTCERCGALLMVSAERGVASTFQMSIGDEPGEGISPTEEIPMPDNVRRMFEAVNDVAEGNITVEDFAAVVSWLEGVVDQNARNYQGRPHVNLESVAEDQREQVIHLMNLTQKAEEDLQEGEACYRQGLALYRMFIEDNNKDHLMEGSRVIWEGTRKLHEVQVALAPLKEKAPLN